MRRKVVIWEEHGVYGVESPTGGASGRTVEDALLRAFTVNHGTPPEVRSTHDMGVLITELFGDRTASSGLASTANTI